MIILFSLMTTLVKIQRKGQMTLPTRLRALAGIVEGDLVEAVFLRGKIVITPKIAIDRSQFPNADDEYTPAQRKIIDARLAKGLADIKAGRTLGPFNNADEMIAHMRGELKKSAADRKSKRAE